MEARLASPGDTIYLVEGTRHGWDRLISKGTFIEYKGWCTGNHYEICVIHRDGLFQKNKNKDPLLQTARADEVYLSYDAAVAAWEVKQLARATSIMYHVTEFTEWRRSRGRLLENEKPNDTQ